MRGRFVVGVSEMCEAKAVAIVASINRPQILHESILSLARQTVPCDILIAAPNKDHVLAATLALPNVKGVFGATGLCGQRNLALSSIKTRPKVIFCFDDDVEVEEHYVERMLEMFEANPEVALANGDNLGLGAAPGTLTRDNAKALIRRALEISSAKSIKPASTGIGCLMSFRGDLLDKVEFDERLPLYGYLEDFDFSMQCSRFGRLVTNHRCHMVHIETAVGRMGSRKRGYSEVVNPIYIGSKHRSVRFGRLLAGSVKRTLKNLIRCRDLAGRKQVEGNLIGWAMVLKGKLAPEYILQMND